MLILSFVGPTYAQVIRSQPCSGAAAAESTVP